jgi:N-acetylmuramoyl-L-alanine amidase
MAKIKVGIYVGHGKQTNGVWDSGATCGSEQEAKRMLPITKAFVKYAKLNGFEVVTDVPKNNINMIKQVAKSEANDVDVHISIHCDWYKAASGSFGLYCKGSKQGKKLATCLNKYVKKMTGIRSKGIIARTDLYELNKTSMPACVFECGSIKADRYEWDTAKEADEYGKALCMGLCKYYGKTFVEKKATATKSATTTQTNKKELYRVRKSWSNAGTQLGAFTSLKNAKALAKKNEGYKVYNSSGKVVYNPTSERVKNT